MKMKKGIFAAMLGAASLMIPSFFAAAAILPGGYGSGGTLDKTTTIIGSFGNIANMLLWIVATLAILVFFWGIVKYIKSAGDAKAAAEGKSIMIYGAIALFVLFSIFGIIRWLRGEFGIQANQDIGNPTVNPGTQAI